MEKFRNAVLFTGGLLIVLSAAAIITGAVFAKYLFCTGAVMFSAAQMTSRPAGSTTTIKRLFAQQVLGCIFFLATGVLLFADFLGRNSWIVTLTIGAIIQLYAIFRIEHEQSKKSEQEDSPEES